MRSSFLSLFSIFAISGTLLAAIPTFQAGIRLKGGELKSKYCFSVGDWNGDGKKDIVMMSAGGDRAWAHLNEGTDAAPVFGFAERIIVNLSETTPSALSYTTCLQLLDWDNDGDLDWIVCDNNIGVMMVNNSGTRTNYTLSQADIILAGTGYFTAFGADWDKDGKYDLIVYDGVKLTWRKNNNANTQPPAFGAARTFKTAAAASINEAHPFVVDWNNDGLPDLVACGAISGDYTSNPYTVGAKTVRLYLGTLSPDSMTNASIIPNVAGGSRLSVVDWNDDGKKDLLVMDSALAMLRLYKNTGTDASPAFAGTPDTVTGTDFSGIDWGMQAQWLDWNKDGKIDVVIAGAFDGHCSGMEPMAKVYLNVSANATPAFKFGNFLSCGGTPVHWEWNGGAASTVAVRDFNHDGNWDMYMAIWRYSSGAPCDLFYYTGGASTAAALAFASETNCSYAKNGAVAYMNPAAGDLSGDNLEDLVMAQPLAYPYPSAIAYYRNTGASASPAFSDANRTVLMNMDASLDGVSSNPCIYDLDGDGKQDLIMGVGLQNWGGQSDYGVCFYPNTGTVSAPSFSRASSSPLMLASGGRVALPAWPKEPSDPRLEFRVAPVIADCDNDGLADLAAAMDVDHGAFNVWSSELWFFRNSAGTTAEIAMPVLTVNELTVSPNPFQARTKIRLDRASSGDNVEFHITNVAGKLVGGFTADGRDLGNGISWDAQGLSVGIYFLQAKFGKKNYCKRLILVK
jgi:hypothetical protein